MNWELFFNQFLNLLFGAGYALWITLCAVVIGVVMGLVLAIMRMTSRKWLTLMAEAYIAAFRGTPMLVQILLFYFTIFPALGLSRLPAIYAGIAALGLNSAAYLGEIFRGGIQSIARGQTEAALSLGMSNYQVMRYVVLPQALANSLPAIGNEFITLIKDSSLLQAIAVPELTYRSMLVAARTYEYGTMYGGIAIFYFAMTFSISKFLGGLEKKMRAGYK